MRHIFLVLLCLVSTNYGRNVQITSDTVTRDTLGSANKLALLLLALDPEGAFNPAGLAAHPSMLDRKHPAQRSPTTHMDVGKRLSFGPPLDVDLSIPQEGWPVPEEGSFLRNLKVVSTSPEGLYVEVDAQTGLQGYIFTSGLDTAYIKSAEDTFRVGDRIDAKMVGLGTTSGRVLLSRKLLMEVEGSEKHELPHDGRVLPKRAEHTPPMQEEKPDPSIPIEGANVPEAGSIHRGAKVMSLEPNGMYVMIEERTNLQAFVFKSLSDNWYVKEMDQTFRLGDLLDVKIKDVSPTSGRLMASRKEVMDEEGREKHQLPDDGRIMPIKPGFR